MESSLLSSLLGFSNGSVNKFPASKNKAIKKIKNTNIENDIKLLLLKINT